MDAPIVVAAILDSQYVGSLLCALLSRLCLAPNFEDRTKRFAQLFNSDIPTEIWSYFKRRKLKISESFRS
jgi:hypothetical protein